MTRTTFLGSRDKDEVKDYYKELCYMTRTTCLGSRGKDDVLNYYQKLCYMTRTTCLGSKDKDGVRELLPGTVIYDSYYYIVFQIFYRALLYIRFLYMKRSYTTIA